MVKSPPNLGANFYPKLVQISAETGMRPEDLLAVMVSESGIDPSSVEKKFKGSGLIGFMPDTLKGLGFKGDWQDFIKLNGEEQLDYVKKLIQNFSKSMNGGAPFTSAAQYYVAIFWPVALKLPGVRSGNPNTLIVEENPETTTDSKSGKKFSKKYYDIGYRVSPSLESNAYKENRLFHGKVPGAITYGDMMRQVEINKKSSIYQKAIADMKASTGRTPSPSSPPPQRSQGYLDRFISMIEEFVDKFIAAVGVSNTKMAHNILPKNKLLILVGSSGDYSSTLEYARILSLGLEEELAAITRICTDGSNIEIECDVAGPKDICFEAIKEFSIAISDAFKVATKKIGSVKSFSLVIPDVKSDYQSLDIKTSERNYRKFRLKFSKN